MKKYFTVPTLVIFISVIFLYGWVQYVLSNPIKIRVYSVNLSYFYLKTGYIQKSLSVLLKGAERAIKLNSTEFPDFYFSQTLDPGDLPSYGFIPEYSSYLEKLYKTRAYKFTDYDFSRILYEVALISYYQEGYQLFEKLMTAAISQDPTLSYWQVELANFYYSKGYLVESRKILTRCQTIPQPANHCKDFERHIDDKLAPFEVGFLLPETEKFFRVKSVMKPSYFVY